MCHNTYQFSGGEDSSTAAETALLRERGHEVIEYTRHNHEIKDRNLLEKGLLFFETTWSRRSYGNIAAICRQHRPDVAHFQNIMPLISPSAYYACAEMDVPVVQTLHNYRSICPGALLMRQGRICEDCISGDFHHALSHRCYHKSWIQTLALARMLKHHRHRGTYSKKIHAYVALTDFARRKFIQGGLPEERIHVKPNFIEDPGFASHPGQGAIFVGRLSEEKGLRTLLSAWTQFKELPLQIVGDGPLLPELKSFAQSHGLTNVHFHGHRSSSYCLTEIKKSRFLVLPSTCYETFGRTIVEAFACGRPVIASDLGAMSELVHPHKIGLLFEAGNPEALAYQIHWMFKNPEECREMGRTARIEYEQKYTPQMNYEMLMDIYSQAIQASRDGSTS